MNAPATPPSPYSASTGSSKVESHTLSVLVDNEPGVLARVVGLFSGRGYNIESLTVAEVTHAEHRSRITIVTSGAPETIEQIHHQLERIVPVRQVTDLTVSSRSLERELGAVLRGTMGNLIVGTKALVARNAPVILVHLPGGGESVLPGPASLVDLEEARRQARTAIRATAPASAEGALADLVASFVDVNVVYDPAATAARREAALAAVPPVVGTVPKGTVLARAGEKLWAPTLRPQNWYSSALPAPVGLAVNVTAVPLTAVAAGEAARATDAGARLSMTE